MIKAKPVLYETVLVPRSLRRCPLALQKIPRVGDKNVIAHLGRANNHFATCADRTLNTVRVDGHTRLRGLRVNLGVVGMRRAIEANTIESVGSIHIDEFSEGLGSEADIRQTDRMGEAIVFVTLGSDEGVACCN